MAPARCRGAPRLAEELADGGGGGAELCESLGGLGPDLGLVDQPLRLVAAPHDPQQLLAVVAPRAQLSLGAGGRSGARSGVCDARGLKNPGCCGQVKREGRGARKCVRARFGGRCRFERSPSVAINMRHSGGWGRGPWIRRGGPRSPVVMADAPVDVNAPGSCSPRFTPSLARRSFSSVTSKSPSASATVSRSAHRNASDAFVMAPAWKTAPFKRGKIQFTIGQVRASDWTGQRRARGTPCRCYPAAAGGASTGLPAARGGSRDHAHDQDGIYNRSAPAGRLLSPTEPGLTPHEHGVKGMTALLRAAAGVGALIRCLFIIFVGSPGCLAQKLCSGARSETTRRL